MFVEDYGWSVSCPSQIYEILAYKVGQAPPTMKHYTLDKVDFQKTLKENSILGFSCEIFYNGASAFELSSASELEEITVYPNDGSVYHFSQSISLISMVKFAFENATSLKAKSLLEKLLEELGETNA